MSKRKVRNQESTHSRTISHSLNIPLTARIRPLYIVCWRDQRSLLGTTYATRAIHTHAASTMNIHIDADGRLVSNPSDREMQRSSAHAAAPDLDAWDFSWVEPHAAKRDIGQLSNRKLIEPSASECRIPTYLDNITGRDWIGIPVSYLFRSVI